MIKIKQPIIVEGKYDKITLENAVDALIIPTNGFGIFKDREKCAMLRALAEREGIIVLTDSDSAGNMIRAYIKKIVGNAKITNVYVPVLHGKEKRKSAPGKEGILGVEGMSREVLLRAFEKSGITATEVKADGRAITKADMYEVGLSGRDNSAEARKRLLKHLQLPEKLSSSAMLDVLNTLLTYDEFIKVACECQGNLIKD